MKTQQVGICTSITAPAGGLAGRRFVGLDGLAIAAGAKALGVVEMSTDAGDQAPVNVTGILLVEAGAAIAAGAEVQTDAQGRAITKAAGGGNGFALDAATGAGELIRIARGI